MHIRGGLQRCTIQIDVYFTLLWKWAAYTKAESVYWSCCHDNRSCNSNSSRNCGSLKNRTKATQQHTVVYHFHRVSSSTLSDFLPLGFFAPSSVFTFTYIFKHMTTSILNALLGWTRVGLNPHNFYLHLLPKRFRGLDAVPVTNSIKTLNETQSIDPTQWPGLHLPPGRGFATFTLAHQHQYTHHYTHRQTVLWKVSLGSH